MLNTSFQDQKNKIIITSVKRRHATRFHCSYGVLLIILLLLAQTCQTHVYGCSQINDGIYGVYVVILSVEKHGEINAVL